MSKKRAEKPKIAIFEDSPRKLEGLRFLFDALGYDIALVATSEEEAEKAIASEYFDGIAAVLVDGNFSPDEHDSIAGNRLATLALERKPGVIIANISRERHPIEGAAVNLNDFEEDTGKFARTLGQVLVERNNQG